MKTFTQIALLLLAEVCAVCALIAVYEAHQYMTVGYGFNPLAAMPFATLVILLPFVFVRYVTDYEG